MKNKYIKLIFLWLLLLAMTYSGFAQQQLLTGTITDEAGKPVRDAIISIKGQPGIETYSDSTGKFTINGQIGQDIEITSGQRHKTSRVDANPVALSIADNDALIPIGFGMNRDKEDLTSAIGIVRSDELSKSRAINPANALFGKIPGLAVLQNGGAAWENDPSLFIRGVGTFRDASILVLVDGFERPISSLSLDEIESVAVLKDAAALAMYGLKGANGVLLVTTKRADTQRSGIEVEYQYGLTQATRLPKFLEGYDYANSVNEALTYDGLSPIYSQNALDYYKSGSSPYLYPNVNWINEAFRDFGNTSNLKVIFQRRARTISYFTLLNYQTDQGLLGPVEKNSGYSTQLDYSKFNFRSNIDISITKTTEFKVNVAGNLRQTQYPGTSVSGIMDAIYNTPSGVYPVKTSHGDWGGTSYYSNNPIAQISATGYKFTHTRELLADFNLVQKLDMLLPGLSAEGALAYDNSALYLEQKTKQYKYVALSVGPGGETVETPYGSNTSLAYSSSLGNQWSETTLRAKLNYLKEWGGNSINSTLLYQQEQVIKTGRSNTFHHKLFAGNIHYSRDMKYFADFTLSYSGTNLLNKDSRYGLFPALSLAWKLSNEDWFANNGFVNDLKIRASWGMTGNDLSIPQDLSAVKFSGSGTYYFTNNSTASGGLNQGRLPSTGATFETSTKSNIGIDVSMFGMLDLNADAFYDHRTNILMESEGLISSVIGVLKPYQTSGIVDNKGVELGINLHNNKGEFTYNVGGQFSYVKNKIIEMGEVYRPYDYLKRTGQSIDQAFGLEAAGFFLSKYEISVYPKQLFSAVNPGDIRYKNQNKDNVINIYDEVPLGYSTRNPELYFSASLGLGYKGFGLDALFQGIANKSVYLNTTSIFWPLRGNTSISDFSDNRWTATTTETATLPRLTTLENVNNFRPNDIWITDGSYLKLRSLEIYYDLPHQLISRLKISDTRLFIRGMDLFSIDHIDIVDPEAIGLVYPICSSYSIGIKIGF